MNNKRDCIYIKTTKPQTTTTINDEVELKFVRNYIWLFRSTIKKTTYSNITVKQSDMKRRSSEKEEDLLKCRRRPIRFGLS